MNKANFAAFIKGAQKAVKKHSPEILTGIGIAGMITTTVLAVKATPKALKLIEKKKEEQQLEKLPLVTTVKTAWMPYIPAAVTGAASVACLVGASRISLKRNAVLATAYKLSETALSEYREKVIETIGERKEQVVRDKVAEEKIKKTPINQGAIFVTDRGNTLCFDPLSSRYFKCDLETIRRAENTLNKRILHDITGVASLNDFYDEIGLAHTDTGDEFGWNSDAPIDLDITAYMIPDDEPMYGGQPCAYIGHYNAPKYEYSKFY